MTFRAPFYVFDLDGTLADAGHRRHLFGDLDAYHAACADDAPLAAGLGLFRALSVAARLDMGRLEIWTARSEAVRGASETWLARHGVPPHALTRMRPLGDVREAAALKVSFLALSDRTPDVLFEDDPRLVAAWRAEGLVCFQVADGPPAFRHAAATRPAWRPRPAQLLTTHGRRR